jgi:hypothetical protein
MISLYQVILLLLVAIPIAGAIGWVGGRQTGRLSLMVELTKNRMLRRNPDDIQFTEWYSSREGSHCIDFDVNAEKLLSLELKENGSVAWTFLAHEFSSRGPSINSDEFRRTFFEWANIPSEEAGDLILFDDDGSMILAGARLRLVNTKRGDVALVNDRGTPLMAIRPQSTSS